VFVTIGAFLFLGESFSYRRLAGIVIAFLGAVVNDPAVLRARRNGRKEAAFVQAIDKNWQGGIKLLEKGWHTWIQRKSAAAEQTLRQERAKQRR